MKEAVVGSPSLSISLFPFSGRHHGCGRVIESRTVPGEQDLLAIVISIASLGTPSFST